MAAWVPVRRGAFPWCACSWRSFRGRILTLPVTPTIRARTNADRRVGQTRKVARHAGGRYLFRMMHDPPVAGDTLAGPWNPGIESQIPPRLLPLATVYRPEHVQSALREAHEL